MAHSHVAYFLFWFFFFGESEQALEELVLEVKTTELYQPRYKYREI